jgi:hypothetical protein
VKEIYSPQSSTIFATFDNCKCFCTKITIPPLKRPAVALLVAG